MSHRCAEAGRERSLSSSPSCPPRILGVFSSPCVDEHELLLFFIYVRFLVDSPRAGGISGRFSAMNTCSAVAQLLLFVKHGFWVSGEFCLRACMGPRGCCLDSYRQGHQGPQSPNAAEVSTWGAKRACGASTFRPSFLFSFLPAENRIALALVTWCLALFFWEREVNGKNMARTLLLSPTNLFVCFSPSTPARREDGPHMASAMCSGCSRPRKTVAGFVPGQIHGTGLTSRDRVSQRCRLAPAALPSTATVFNRVKEPKPFVGFWLLQL